MYLIDTNVLSELRKGARANTGVIDFFRSMESEQVPLYLSVITIGELRRGIELIRHRGDVQQSKLLENWLSIILLEYSEQVLGINQDIAQLWGKLRSPAYEHAIDKLIAATALIHDLVVVTRNRKDFEKTGVRVLNPFEG